MSFSTLQQWLYTFTQWCFFFLFFIFYPYLTNIIKTNIPVNRAVFTTLDWLETTFLFVGKISPKGDIKNLAFENQFIGESKKGLKKITIFFYIWFSMCSHKYRRLAKFRQFLTWNIWFRPLQRIFPWKKWPKFTKFRTKIRITRFFWWVSAVANNIRRILVFF
jgi:hypothetical protein